MACLCPRCRGSTPGMAHGVGVGGGGGSTPATPAYLLLSPPPRHPATPAYFRFSVPLLLLLFLLLSPLFPFPLRGDRHGNEEKESGDGRRGDPELAEENQGPDPAERAIGITGLTSWWEAFQTWAKLAWINFRPPESLYPRSDSSAGKVMKDAATRSFETSKETVQHTAESAAELAGEAMHKTKEKIKRTVSRPDGDPDAEL